MAGFFKIDDQGEIYVLDGNGSGGGDWVATGHQVSLTNDALANNWIHLTFRQDFEDQLWDLYIDRSLRAANLGFLESGANHLAAFVLMGTATSSSFVDEITVSAENPLFADSDLDGMPDEWEGNHELDPQLNDRELDPNEDGISNIEHYMANSDPSAAGAGKGSGSKEDVDSGEENLLLVTEGGASIHGLKWFDRNGSGERDDDEPGLPGVTIYLDINRNAILDEGEPNAETMEDDPDTAENEAGMYWLENLEPGSYQLREVVPEGFAQSFPVIIHGIPAWYEAMVERNAVLRGGDFGNRPAGGVGSIHGMKWFDRNGNGERDANEPGLPGVTIYLDLNLNGQLDEGEPNTETMEDDPETNLDDSGIYWITDLAPGVYIVREIVPDGLVQSFPLTANEVRDSWVVNLIEAPSIDGVDFGNRPIRRGSIHGLKWLDGNGNGSQDANEPGLPGVTIYLDLNLNRMLDEDEPSSVSMRDNPDTDFDEGGRYWLTNLLPGVFSLREVVPDGFEQTFPLRFGSPAGHVATLEEGQVLEGGNFGNWPINAPGSIHGVKWIDENGNAERDPDEPGLPGVTIYLDLNNNGRPDPDEPRAVTMEDDLLTDFDEDGTYWLDDVDPGRYVVREVVPDGFLQTFPVNRFEPDIPDDGQFTEVSPEKIDVVLAAGETKFGEVSVAILPFCFVPVEVDVVASDPGILFQNLTGVQINGCGSDTSVFQIQLTGDGLPHAFELRFVDASEGVLGTIPVRIRVPGQSAAHFVVVERGEVVERIDFGNQPIRPGSIHGVKWVDDNGNAERDPDEPGLPGVIIYLDLNKNGMPDPDEPRAETMEDDPITDFDESGMYWLEDVEPGRYVVREVIPDDFLQTFPVNPFEPEIPDNGGFTEVSPKKIDVVLASGETKLGEVSISILPFCIVPVEVDVVASDPGILFQNLTGVLVNGCGGDTSKFEVQLTGDGLPHQFELQFVNASSGNVLDAIPVRLQIPGQSAAHFVCR